MVEQRSQIVECNLLHESSQNWLPLLKEELSFFPSRPIVTLGEPLLKALLIDAKKALVRRYWGYTPDWVRTKAVFSFVSQEENKLDRRLFPFPHQPSLRKKFYGATLQSYLGYMKAAMTQG
jgi:uracil-DNA glycosylase